MNIQELVMSKKGLGVGMGIIVLALVVFAARYEYATPETVVGIENTETASSENATTTEATTTKAATTAPAPLSYTRALQLYKDKKIQFTPSCQAYPNTVTYKNNTAIMLDNRSGAPQTIRFGGRTYTIGAYSFKIVTVYAPNTPASFYVDCNSMQNVATIGVQK